MDAKQGMGNWLRGIARSYESERLGGRGRREARRQPESQRQPIVADHAQARSDFRIMPVPLSSRRLKQPLGAEQGQRSMNGTKGKNVLAGDVGTEDVAGCGERFGRSP